MNPAVDILVNGRRITLPQGSSAAAAVMAAQDRALRSDPMGNPRGALCGMGVCMECRATVDGVPHQRTCQIEIRPGMEIRTDVQ